MKRRLACLIGGAAVLASVSWLIDPAHLRQSDRNYNEIESINKARNLIYACQLYRKISEPDGKYPAALSDLITLPSKVTNFDFNPEQDLTDGWDRPLRYAVVMNEKGEPEPYVWAERKVFGKLYLYGAMGTSEGGVVTFGLPE